MLNINYKGPSAYRNKRKMTSHNILKKNNLTEISLPNGITDTESLSNLPNICMLKHFINTNENFTALIKGPLKKIDWLVKIWHYFGQFIVLYLVFKHF